MIAEGVLLYKCRLCGQLSEGAHTPDSFHTLICMGNNKPLPSHWGGREMATQTTVHSCSDGRIGIADIAGARGDKE